MERIQEIDRDISYLNNAISAFNSSISTTKTRLKTNDEVLLNITKEINGIAVNTFLYSYLEDANQKLINKLNMLSGGINSVSSMVNDNVSSMISYLHEEKSKIEKYNMSITEDGVDNNG